MRPTLIISSIVFVALACAAAPARAEQRAGSGGAHAAPRSAHAARAVPREVVRRPVVVAPRVAVAPYRFVQPYYAFRPRLNLGFGLFVGYPVAYPYYYPYPYAYASPYPYPYDPYPPAPYSYPSYPYPPQNPSTSYPPPAYPQSGGVTVQPGATNSAGVSFEITPSDADVYVDGVYVGRVSNFGPNYEPLSVTPGRHHIELRRPGYQTLTIDADAIAGEVIPYQGTMQRQ